MLTHSPERSIRVLALSILCAATLVLAHRPWGDCLLIIAAPQPQVQTPTGRVWQSGQSRSLDSAAHDGNEETYAVITPENRDSQVQVGLEWALPRRISGLRVAYASLNGNTYEPTPDFQSLEYRDGQEWKTLETQLLIDYRRNKALASAQESGLALWDYRFAAVEAAGIRIKLSRTVSTVRWEQRYVIRELEPYLAESERTQPSRVLVLGQPLGAKQWESSTNWASAAAGAVQSRDEKGTVISWPRPRMLSELELAAEDWSGPLQWWDGQRWRDIELTHVEKDLSQPPRLRARFLPRAIRRLRVVNLFDSSTLQLRTEFAREYFDRVYQSGRDLLMERILHEPSEPDYAGAASLLLPLDMQTSVIGRPGDPVECLVHWNGTLVETESGDQGAWNHGAKQTIPGKEKWIDRWFAFAADGETFGSNLDRTSRSYLDGFLPAVVTRYSKGEIQFEEEVFTTAPGDPVYAQSVTVRISNRGRANGKATLSLIAGRRRSASSAQRAAPAGGVPSPMNLDPLDTEYQFDPDRQTVKNGAGEIVLFAQSAFEHTGNGLEHTLSYPVELVPGASKELHFLVPSVNEPLTSIAALLSWRLQEGRDRFRRYWSEQLQGNVKLSLPEPPLNDIHRNLVAQAMIILNDEQKLKYGAYWYEWYFGVEEGWPITALAQFGHPDLAKTAIRTMLSQELTDKSNYHHQYRNGLAPMYAAQVYRLTRDREWLRTIAPQLKESANWIVQARHQKEGKLPEYQGLLPRHAYGGDVHTPAYSIYSNATCWKGLQDTAYLLRELGETELAEKYSADAIEYRRTIEQVVSTYSNRDFQPPFVPVALEIGAPGSHDYRKVETPYPFIPSDPLGNYWILMAPLMLETAIFPPDGLVSRWVTDFMEQRGGLLAGLARFYRGVDHIYGFAYPLQLFERGDRKKFLATVYSVLAHGNSRDSFTSPEVAGVFPLRTDNLAWQEAFRRTMWNWDLYGSGWMQGEFGKAIGAEPLSAGTGMALQLVRKMVVSEELDGSGNPTGSLDLLKMAPSGWLEDGKRIEAAGMPTYFGGVTLRVESQLSRNKIVGRFEPSSNFALSGKLTLWLRHPRGLPIKAVRFDRALDRSFTTEAVALPTSGVTEFEVEF